MRIETLHGLARALERYWVVLLILAFKIWSTIRSFRSSRKSRRDLEEIARSLGWILKPRRWLTMETGIVGEWRGRETRLRYVATGNIPVLTISVATLLPGRFVIQRRAEGGGLLTHALRPFGPPEVRLPNVEDAETFRAWADDPFLLERTFAVPGIRPALATAFTDISGPFAGLATSFSLKKRMFRFTRAVRRSTGGRLNWLVWTLRSAPNLEILRAAAEEEWMVLSLAAGLG